MIDSLKDQYALLNEVLLNWHGMNDGEYANWLKHKGDELLEKIAIEEE